MHIHSHHTPLQNQQISDFISRPNHLPNHPVSYITYTLLHPEDIWYFHTNADMHRHGSIQNGSISAPPFIRIALFLHLFIPQIILHLISYFTVFVLSPYLHLTIFWLIFTFYLNSLFKLPMHDYNLFISQYQFFCIIFNLSLYFASQ